MSEPVGQRRRKAKPFIPPQCKEGRPLRERGVVGARRMAVAEQRAITPFPMVYRSNSAHLSLKSEGKWTSLSGQAHPSHLTECPPICAGEG